MPTTVGDYGWRVPVNADAVDVPGDMSRLATDINSTVKTHYTALNARLDDAWIQYAPELRLGSGAVVAFGSGTRVGRYKKLGTTVIGKIFMQRAADTNVGGGTEDYVITLPNAHGGPTPVPTSGNVMGGGIFYGNAAVFTFTMDHRGAGDFAMRIPNGAASGLLQSLRLRNNSITYATGDSWHCWFIYETAA